MSKPEQLNYLAGRVSHLFQRIFGRGVSGLGEGGEYMTAASGGVKPDTSSYQPSEAMFESLSELKLKSSCVHYVCTTSMK